MKKDLALATRRAGFQATPAAYMLVLKLPPALLEEIHSIKKDFFKKYGPAQGATRTQLTLVKFNQYEFMEPRLLPRINTIAGDLPSFILDLQGFGSLPTHSIFIHVLGKVPILHTIQALRKMRQLFYINEDTKPWFITEPTVMIAQKLLPGQYEKAWLHFNHQSFSGRFIADQLCLLKRRENGDAWKVVATFPFEQKKISGVQEKLF
ncbi:MAG: hypothetical protein JSS67_09455 [Bacteroidetes bacterium]|nr:hypothetical protein [Bacteroidota bacterium]